MLGVLGGITASETLWPGIHQDGFVYTTVAVNLANKLGTVVNVFDFQAGNQPHDNAFNAHGQFYYPIVAALMPGTGYEAFLKAVHLLNLACYILAVAVFYLLIRRVLRCSCLWAVGLAVAIAYSLGGVMFYLQGRPEHGIPIVLLVFLLVRELKRNASLPAWLWGAQVGIVAAISPLPGAFLGICWVVSSALNNIQAKILLVWIVQCAIGAVVAWSVVTSLVYEESLKDLFSNTIGSVKAYNKLNNIIPSFPYINWQWFKVSWITREYFPGVGLLYLGVIIVFAVILVKYKGSWFNKTVIAICVVLMLPGIWHSGFAHAPINYTFLCLFPTFAAWFIGSIRRLDGRAYKLIRVDSRAPAGAGLCLLLLVLFGLPGIGFARIMFLQPFVMKQGITFQDSFQRVQCLKDSLGPKEVILIDLYSNARSAVVFDGPPWRFQAFEDFLDGDLKTVEREHGLRAKYRIYLQENNTRPPEKPGFMLMETHFNTVPIKMFGLTLSEMTPGYGYAVYKRLPAQDK